MKTMSAKAKTHTAMMAIVITVDHVYLPLEPGENVVVAWPAPNVSTSKVLRDTRLQVPAKLARLLCFRGQAEPLTPEAPNPSAEASVKAEGA
ncbi:MAG: hypothetical protein K2X72_04305 [Reyranella sp.]|nr:hypothetical protein [Reyranella sp.]